MHVHNASTVAMHAYAREREVEMALDIEEQEAEYDVYLYWYSDPSEDKVVVGFVSSLLYTTR